MERKKNPQTGRGRRSCPSTDEAEIATGLTRKKPTVLYNQTTTNMRDSLSKKLRKRSFGYI